MLSVLRAKILNRDARLGARLQYLRNAIADRIVVRRPRTDPSAIGMAAGTRRHCRRSWAGSWPGVGWKMRLPIACLRQISPCDGGRRNYWPVPRNWHDRTAATYWRLR